MPANQNEVTDQVILAMIDKLYKQQEEAKLKAGLSTSENELPNANLVSVDD
jgi:hypothetical protein